MKIVRTSSFSIGMQEFRECVEHIGVEDINQSGMHFTWNQRPNATSGILKKLDRVMGNGEFINSFLNAYAVFQPHRLSDHSPAVLKIPLVKSNKPKPFKFANFVTCKKEFIPLVKEAWKKDNDGYSMFKVVQKLKSFKPSIRKVIVE